MLAAFVYFILPAILLILGLPIFVVLILTSLAAILLIAHVPLQAIQTYMFGSLDNFPLLAVPFFVLAGEIMGRGGIANRVVTWVVSIIGGVRGSLAVTTVASSELFGAMAHTSVGTVVAIGRLLFPSLTKHGYSERFAVSLITSSGAVAVIIPPSISMILYAMTAQVSAIKLFTAGILPSILIGIVDAVYVLVYARIKMVQLSSPARWKNIWTSTKEASWAIGTIVVIFGGIYGGVFTPTEAAGVAVVYSLFVAMFVYREVGLTELGGIIVSSVVLISQILIIVTGAGIYSWLMTTSGIPQNLINAVSRAALAELADAVVRQYRVVDRRQLSRTAGRDFDPHAASAAGRRSGRSQCAALWNHHGGQFEHRAIYAAVPIKPVRRTRHLQCTDGHDLSRRAAVHHRQLCRPLGHYLRAGDLYGADRRGALVAAIDPSCPRIVVRRAASRRSPMSEASTS